MQKNDKIVNIGIFNGLTEEMVSSFAKDLERIHFGKGDAIITEHSWGDNLFFICRGKVEINKGLNNPETPFAQLSVLEPESFLAKWV
jgi:CRP-like cAMP-binding protein